MFNKAVESLLICSDAQVLFDVFLFILKLMLVKAIEYFVGFLSLLVL